MQNGQDHGIVTIVAVQHNVAAVPKFNEPLTKLRLHVFCRPADTGLLNDDFHSFANGAHRTLGCICVFFGKKYMETL